MHGPTDPGERYDPTRPGDGFGIYIHVPFCRHRCDYCAFATYVDRDHLMDRYVEACKTEIARARDRGELRPATSVFVGGGTPSRLDAEALCRLLATIEKTPTCEVTVECNPEDASLPRFQLYRDGGVNRLSLGIQSTVDHVLDSLGRRRSPTALDEIAVAVNAAGMPTWNLDLMIGAAAEREEDLERSLTDVLSLDDPPPHLSVYMLTIEPGTPLAQDKSRVPDPDIEAARYEKVDRILAETGYEWEEISNWALPGHGCRHNRLYWHQGEYRGFGSAAHSHRAGHRWWNVRTPERFIECIEEGRDPVAGSEDLSMVQREEERLALLLRTPTGVPAGTLPVLSDFDDLVERREGRAVLTVRGRLLADALTATLQAGIQSKGPQEMSNPVGNLRR